MPNSVAMRRNQIVVLVALAWLGGCATPSTPPAGGQTRGVPDAPDGCSREAEDYDGFLDEDGCPDLDNDQDGLPDVDDACPDAAEDLDSYQDGDGCPDPDNDGDGVADASDACPCHPEDDNGVDDEDGCPDCASDFDYVTIRILEQIRFSRDSAVLDPDLPALDSVVTLLREQPELTRVILHGHAAGERDMPSLSLRRAETVRDHLVAHGIDTARLTVRSHAGRFPLDPEDADVSRRVDFDIEETSLRRELSCGSVPSVVECGDGAPRQRTPMQVPYELEIRYAVEETQ
ncbi:MAG: OmpA family protein [Sandaracinaceae bacterium]